MQKRKLEFFFLMVWIIVSVTAFFPTIILNLSLYRGVRYLVYALLLLMLVATSGINALKNKFVAFFAVTLIFLGVMLLIFSSMNYRVVWSDYVNLVIVFLSICVGICCRMDEDQLEVLLMIYGVITAICGLYTMIYFVGAVRLTDYMYVVDTKNMVGQLVATGGVGLFIITFSSNRWRTIKIVFLVLSLVLEFVLRCRTALVAMLLFVAYFLWKRYDYRYLIVYLLVGSAVFAIFHEQIMNFLDAALIGNTDVSDIDSLSAGRWHRNVDGWEFFTTYPIFGEMNTPSDLPNIHNYMLRRMVAYGIFSFPFILIYLVFLFKLIKHWIRVDVQEIPCAGLLMLIIPFFASFLEPLSPFGPGLVQVMTFFFFGCYLSIRREDNSVVF